MTTVGISDDELESRLRDVLNAVDPVRTPTRAEVDAMFDRHDAGREVVAAAREWRANYGNTSRAYSAACLQLTAAVDRLEALSVTPALARNVTPGPLCRSVRDDRLPLVLADRNGSAERSGGERG